jgi:hypothetical protein
MLAFKYDRAYKAEVKREVGRRKRRVWVTSRLEAFLSPAIRQLYWQANKLTEAVGDASSTGYLNNARIRNYLTPGQHDSKEALVAAM